MLNAKLAIFQRYHGENKLHSMKWCRCPLCSRPTAEFYLFSANSLKQQFTDRHVAPLVHIILIPSQPVLSPSYCMLSGEATNTNCIVLGSNPRSTALEASMLTITPQMRFVFNTKPLYKVKWQWLNIYLTIDSAETLHDVTGLLI